MDENAILEFDDNSTDFSYKFITNKQYPPFGEILNFKKLNRAALGMCPSLSNYNVNGTVNKRSPASEELEDSIKKNDNGKINEKLQISNDLTKTQIKQKKTKKSRIVAEYQASQIPDNKGSTLSIDDLVKFVNGNEKNRNANKVHKQKVIIRNKPHKPQNGFSCNSITRTVEISKVDDLNSKNSHFDFQKGLSPTIVGQLETVIGCDKNLIENDSKILVDDDTDNNAFFQVVRRKSRHKKVDANLPRCETIVKHYDGNRKRDDCLDRPQRVVTAKFSLDKGASPTNDKESLNVFINKLWIEFQSCYEKYKSLNVCLSSPKKEIIS